MLDKDAILTGKEFENFMSGYAEGSKDAVSQFIGSATAYEEANPEEVNSQGYQKGYKAGVKFMYDKIMRKLYEGEDTYTDEERIIGVVNGKVDVEKLDTDSEDYYSGYCDGISNAYECYEVQPEHNCPYHPQGSCDRSAPCYGCDSCTEDLEQPTAEYKRGYMAGYEMGVSIWYESPEEVREPISPEVQKKLEDIWNGFGEPMTQEELDELVEVDRDYLDELSFIQGKKMGFDSSYEVGYSEAEDDIEKYNVVLDGEFLDQIQEFKEQILSYRKEYDNGKNKDHNFMIYDLHHSLICLTESWVMDKVWKYWDKNKGDNDD